MHIPNHVKIIIFLIIIGVGLPFGINQATQKYNESVAKSVIINFHSLEMVYSAKKWEFTEDIHDLRHDVDISLAEGVEKAQTIHEDPKPFEGYLFAVISDGYGIGLCAYPAIPGKSASKMYLVLLDDDYDSIGNSRTFTMYTANYEDIGSPITEWPEQEDLEEFKRSQEKFGATLSILLNS